jgi:hypothetical protein
VVKRHHPIVEIGAPLGLASAGSLDIGLNIIETWPGRTAQGFPCDRSDCRYGLGKGSSDNLGDQVAAMFQLISYRCGLDLISDDGHAGFVGTSRMPV